MGVGVMVRMWIRASGVSLGVGVDVGVHYSKTGIVIFCRKDNFNLLAEYG